MHAQRYENAMRSEFMQQLKNHLYHYFQYVDFHFYVISIHIFYAKFLRF